MAIIISGFPGIGKSKLFEVSNKAHLTDSDSSKFEKKNFPQNYIEHIKKMIPKKFIILTSSHIEVRNAMLDEKLNFIYVIPSIDRKEEFIENYKKRGNTKEFIENVNVNWERWLQISVLNEKYPVYVCKIGYLADNFEGIVKEYYRFYNRRR